MCLYPKLMRNPKYKNGGLYIKDPRILYVPISCGKCRDCYKKRGLDWKIRLFEELKKKDNPKPYFIALTYNQESYTKIDITINDKIDGYDRENAIALYGSNHFLDRYRKKYGKSLRHWFITELGHQNTERIHIHGIIWTDQDFEEIRNLWGYGYVYPRDYQIKNNFVNHQTINYIIKYVTKLDFKHKYYKPIILTSNGIGNNYKPSSYELNHDVYKTRAGHEFSLPQYYRQKMFSDEARENMWLEKMDENVRYIQSRKVDANDFELITALLEQAQHESERKGYIGDKVNWKAKKHENEQRDLLRKVKYPATDTKQKSKITK
jgi:hypothetical protein